MSNIIPFPKPEADPKPVSAPKPRCTDVQCDACGETVDADEYHADTDQCIECHDGSGLAIDECGCERCWDRVISRADFSDND